MDIFDPTSRKIASTYDQVPYESRPFSQSHPSRSAAVAQLFGLPHAEIGGARVLELGCAAGGNIIPMAMNFPGARFLGVDISARQVEDGRRRIATLGLGNIELRQQSILDFSAGDGRFDYIICHGVYSWVPHHIRAAILRICAENLTENGIAYVSYNVYPGWRLRGVLRDAMMFHKADRAAGDAVGDTRAFLGGLAQLTNPSTPYGQMLRQEMKSLAVQSDYYIAHEYLEDTNEPCHVVDFLRDAAVRGLAYLTDVNVGLSIAENFGNDAGQMLRQVSGNRLERMEQYIDFLTGRTFRQSLLVKAHQHPKIMRNLDASRLARLHVSAHLKIADDADTHVVDPLGRRMPVDDPGVRTALVRLGQSYPRTWTLEQLSDQTGAAADQLRDAVFRLVISGMADVRAVGVTAADALVEKPLAAPLARADAAAGLAWTTNAAHDAAGLSAVSVALLPLLDGTRDQAMLVDEIVARAKAGAIVFLKDGQPIKEADAFAGLAQEHVRVSLTGLLSGAMLVDG